MVYTDKKFKSTVSAAARDNSTVIATFIKNSPAWEIASELEPGNREIDQVILYLIYSPKNRIMTTSAVNQKKWGIISKSRYIDWISKTDAEKAGIDGLNFGNNGFAVFDYETLLDKLFDCTHSYDYKKHSTDGVYTHVSSRFPNRNYFTTSKLVEANFDELDETN